MEGCMAAIAGKTCMEFFNGGRSDHQKATVGVTYPVDFDSRPLTIKSAS